MKPSFLEMLLSVVALFISRTIGSFIVSPNFGVKSGVITAPSGADAKIKATAAAEPAVKTLSDAMKDGFSAADDDKIAVVNLATRKVTILPTGTNIATLTGATGIGLLATITMDDPTKANGEMSADDVSEDDMGAAISAIVETATKPSFSVPALLNRIEDAVAKSDGGFAGGNSGLVVVDQAGATVKVYGGSTENVEAVNGAALAEDAELVQTLTPSAGRQFGE